MPWYRETQKVGRLLRHIGWFYRHHEIEPPVKIPKARPIRSVGKDPIKTLIKDVKYLSGYLVKYRTWASGTYDQLIDVIHVPSKVGRKAQRRGVERRVARRRPPHPTTREALAKAILEHPNSYFPGNFTGGSAKAGLQRTAAGAKAYVPVAGWYVNIDIRILAFCYDLLQHGKVSINCLVNGRHTSLSSQHYKGEAADIDKNASSQSALRAIYAVAAKHGLVVLDEDIYHYHVHT